MENKEKEFERILNSIKGIESAEPKPYFYTRLKARMENELLQPKKVFGFVLKPIYAYTAALVLVLINIVTISNFSKITSLENTAESYNLYQP